MLLLTHVYEKNGFNLKAPPQTRELFSKQETYKLKRKPNDVNEILFEK